MTDQPYDANDPDNPLNGGTSETITPPAEPAADGEDNPIEGVPTPGPEGAPE